MKPSQSIEVVELTKALLISLVSGFEPDEESIEYAKSLGIDIDHLRELADEEK